MKTNQAFRAGSLVFVFLMRLISGSTENAQGNKTAVFDNEELQRVLKENKIPVLGIGAIKDGKLKQIRVYGKLRNGKPAPLNTIFNVASLTKPVVAMLALRLVSSGKWNLDEPLDRYWIDPDIKDDPRHKKLTTRIILSHQTGFPNWRWLGKSRKLEFTFEPGTKYQYSGEGLEYLRKALEIKFKQPIEKLADVVIFKVLKMRDTRFVWDANMNESRFALGYDTLGHPYKLNRSTKANAADDLLTTVEDYGKFLVSVMNGDGLSRSVFNEMIRHQVKTKDNKYFGLGWEIYDLGNGEYAMSHGGSDQGVRTLVFLLPKSKQGLIIFTNSDNGTNVYLRLITEYLKEFGKQIIAIETKQNE